MATANGPPKFCTNCAIGEEHGAALKCCAGCRAEFYCSTVCQRRDWKARHKHTCNKGTDAIVDTSDPSDPSDPSNCYNGCTNGWRLTAPPRVVADRVRPAYICHTCNDEAAAGTKFRWCPTCRVTAFCSTRCWNQGWKDHEAVCDNMSSMNAHSMMKTTSSMMTRDSRGSCAGCNEGLGDHPVSCPNCIVATVCSLRCHDRHRCEPMGGFLRLASDSAAISGHDTDFHDFKFEDHDHLRSGVDISAVPLAVFYEWLPHLRRGEVIPDAQCAAGGCTTDDKVMLISPASSVFTHLAQAFTSESSTPLYEAAREIYHIYVEQMTWMGLHAKLVASAKTAAPFRRYSRFRYDIPSDNLRCILTSIQQLIAWTKEYVGVIPRVAITFESQPALKQAIASVLVEVTGEATELMLERVRVISEAIVWMRQVPAKYPNATLFIKPGVQAILACINTPTAFLHMPIDVSDVPSDAGNDPQ